MIGSTNAINTTFYQKLNFNFIRDIAPVSSITRQPQAMLANPLFAAKTIPEFIDYAKANPGKVNMSSPGIGTISHLAGELFKLMAGGAGIALAKQYQAQGLDMLDTHAQFQDKSISVEAGLMDMLDRMQSGRFKVFNHLNDWFDEFRLYHRKDGRVHKEGDDLMSATRYAVMMLRYARTDIPPKPRSIRSGRAGWMAA